MQQKLLSFLCPYHRASASNSSIWFIHPNWNCYNFPTGICGRMTHRSHVAYIELSSVCLIKNCCQCIWRKKNKKIVFNEFIYSDLQLFLHLSASCIFVYLNKKTKWFSINLFSLLLFISLEPYIGLAKRERTHIAFSFRFVVTHSGIEFTILYIQKTQHLPLSSLQLWFIYTINQ